MKVTYLDHMGTDLTVVNAARVSFAKESDWDYSSCPDMYRMPPEIMEEYKKLGKSDAKLIAYLAKHNHWTPFAHTAISLHFKVPFFVAAQIKKHQVGFVVNEVSRRYVDSDPEFYMPEVWRKRAENVKQGSSEEGLDLNEYDVTTGEHVSEALKAWDIKYEPDRYSAEYGLLDYIEDTIDDVTKAYQRLLSVGVCPEQARMILPLSTYTEFWMTGSLAAWARMFKQRSQSDAQKEIRDVAAQVSDIIEPLFPVSWKELIRSNGKEE